MLSMLSEYLDHVAGGEGKRLVAATAQPEAGAEERGEADPDDGPDARFLDRDGVRLAMEDAEVDGEHRQDEEDEAAPDEKS